MIGVPVARLLGIEIRLQLGWILVVPFVAAIAAIQVSVVEPTINPAVQWLLGGVVAAGFFASALIHDLSHAVLARRRGVEVRSILISFFGGTTPLDPASQDPGDDLVIAVAGPVVSIGLGVVLGLLALAVAAAGGSTGEVAAQVLVVLAVLNLILGIVNVVPAYPLDGGRIVRAIAWRRTGREKDGWRAAGTVGRIVGLAVVAIGFGVIALGDVTNGAMVSLSGWFLILSARSIRDRIRVDELIGDLRVGDVMETDTPTVHPGLTVDTFAAQLLDGDVPTTAIPVLSDDAVVGILGVRQVQRLRPAELAAKRVEDVMARPPRLPMVDPADGLVSAVEKLQRAGLDGVPVVEHGRLVGVLTRRSIGLAVQARTGSARGGEASGGDEGAREDAGTGGWAGGGDGPSGDDGQSGDASDTGPGSGASASADADADADAMPRGPTPGAPA
ncbi:MAG: CBS domain-containing protein [Chloroflexi bacterium]|nr:CBS domain-containing protein [Chloroflexota bacterium]